MTITDSEKVIKGLECCAAMSGDECRECPYGHECRDTDLPYGMPHLAADALTLLKEQEPLAISEGKINKCVCGKEINRYWHPEYCGFCGKKLEWY
jgi:hypothetical protein